MPEMDLKQPGFTYSVCGPFTKNKERIQKFKETGDTKCIYKNEFDKACFSILNMMDIKGGLLLWFTNFLMKSPQVVVLICTQIMKN